jgi:hypothetical protein
MGKGRCPIQRETGRRSALLRVLDRLLQSDPNVRKSAPIHAVGSTQVSISHEVVTDPLNLHSSLELERKSKENNALSVVSI